jgi:hypothetical protein
LVFIEGDLSRPAYGPRADTRKVNRQGDMNMEPMLSPPVFGFATAVAWSPDGSRIAGASFYGADLSVWEQVWLKDQPIQPNRQRTLR